MQKYYIKKISLMNLEIRVLTWASERLIIVWNSLYIYIDICTYLHSACLGIFESLSFRILVQCLIGNNAPPVTVMVPSVLRNLIRWYS